MSILQISEFFLRVLINGCFRIVKQTLIYVGNACRNSSALKISAECSAGVFNHNHRYAVSGYELQNKPAQIIILREGFKMLINIFSVQGDGFATAVRCFKRDQVEQTLQDGM